MFERLREAIAATPGVDGSRRFGGHADQRKHVEQPDHRAGYDGAGTRPHAPSINRVTPGLLQRDEHADPARARHRADGSTRHARECLLVNEAFVEEVFQGQNALGEAFTHRRTGFAPRGDRRDCRASWPTPSTPNLRETPQPTMYAAWAQEETAASSARDQHSGATAPPTASARRSSRPSRAFTKKPSSTSARFDEDLARRGAPRATGCDVLGVLRRAGAAVRSDWPVRCHVLLRDRRRSERSAFAWRSAPQPSKVMRQVLGNVAWIVIDRPRHWRMRITRRRRFVNTLLFNLVASDVTMVVIAAVALAVAAGLAGYLPARRAARVDPMVALRER